MGRGCSGREDEEGGDEWGVTLEEKSHLRLLAFTCGICMVEQDWVSCGGLSCLLTVIYARPALHMVHHGLRKRCGCVYLEHDFLCLL